MSPSLKVTPPEDSSARVSTQFENPKSSPLTGILLVSAIVIGVSGMIFQSRIKAFFNHIPVASQSKSVATAPASPILAKIFPASKTPLPPVPPHTFHVTSISLLGATRIAVIDGQQVLEGRAVAVPGQPGWKVAEIHDGSVVLDYLGNRVPCPIEGPAAKPLNDRLHSLN